MTDISSMGSARAALENQQRRVSPEQRARREAVDRRNAGIQRVGPRPADGVTFGSGKVGGKGKRAGGSAGEE